MYRFLLLTMSHGSAHLEPLAVANLLKVPQGFLPLDLKCPVSEMTLRSDLIVYYFEVGEIPNNDSGSFLFVYEKNGIGRVLDSGGRVNMLTPSNTACCRKFRGFSSKGLNWIEFTCFFPETMPVLTGMAVPGR